MELGLRAPAIDWSPVTLIRHLRWGKVQSPTLGASLKSVEANPRVRRGGEWLCWPVYGGRGLCGRWHLAHRANPANLSSGWVSDARGCTVKARMAFIATGTGAGLARARGCAHRRSAEGVLWRTRTRRTRGRLFLPLFKRLLVGSQTCESCQGSCARSLPST
jgi:hypothetical protein